MDQVEIAVIYGVVVLTIVTVHIAAIVAVISRIRRKHHTWDVEEIFRQEG